jgi:purine-nucleoside/S-methyl-5'-thioadenosine phosphorylase / adenosine deaminase
MSIPELDAMIGINHAFTTRQNGLGARNSGIKSPGDWDAVAEVFRISPDRLVTVNQVHGDTIVSVDEKNYRALKAARADALITDAPGIAISVETADCVPVLLFDPVTRAIAAIHAGWRGMVKKIVQKTVTKMQDRFGSDPSRMIAAIGPAIGPECYEVDEPVMGPMREAFSFWQEVTKTREAGRWSLDLVKTGKTELARLGLVEKNIHSLGLCTSCRNDLFYSFRDEGRTGRMLSVIMLKP